MPFFLYLWAYNARNILFAVSCARTLIHKGSLWRTHVILKLSYLASTVNFEGKNDLCSNERYFSSSKFKASKKKKDRFVQALNPWPLRYRCSTLPTGSWSLSWFVINTWVVNERLWYMNIIHSKLNADW